MVIFMIKINELDSILSKEVKPSKVKSSDIDLKKIDQLFKTKFSEAYQCAIKGNIIYRGDRNLTVDSAIIKPGKRKSQNTSNYCTVLISHLLPSWKDFPKRDSSFICTTNKDQARDYAFDQARDYADYAFDKNVYHVFPENGAKLGICSKRDFWESCNTQLKPLKIYDLPDLNDELEHFYNCIMSDVGKVAEDDVDSILSTPKKWIQFDKIVNEAFNIIDKLNNSENLTAKQKRIAINLQNRNRLLFGKLYEYHQNGQSFLESLDKNLLNAQANGNSWCFIEDFLNSDEPSGEVWTDATCLFISASTMEKLINQNILDKWFEGR